MKRFGVALALLVSSTLPAGLDAQQTITEYVASMDAQEGFLPIYWDDAEGKLYMRVSRINAPFLYLTSLATGMGSNRLGLDRGLIGQESVARFTRTGPRVMLVLDNPQFRATSENEDLLRSVEESFPTSTVAGFEIVAEEGTDVLIDVTEFLMRDAMGVTQRLSQAGQGTFTLQRDRSTVHRSRTKAFPINTELEVSLTFTSNAPGAEVRRHSPDGRSITLRQHHSFVQLPDDNYRPRPFDPRIGIFNVGFFDYAEPLDRGYQRRYARRHRLSKRNPAAAISEPIEPIVYYMDRGIPEPYRTAFKEGLAWFNDLFRAAGFENAFRVEDMPDEMDPLDARYDVIQWVHRTEAGSSIGPSFVDPRTGEIIKAAVRMDSHRSLVDYNLYAGALPAVDAGLQMELLEADAALGDWIASMDPDISAEEFAMARRRQHAAHEIGHTLGLAHNFIAASYGRASVMDYPAPLITLENGTVRLADAYRPGPGAYDSIAIRYAYTEFSEAEEAAGLRAIVDEAIDRGLAFITNPHENPASSHPEATTWINGSNVIDELRRVTEVRRVLIDRFDESAITDGQPMYLLNRRLVAVYLHHRFTLTAAIKMIGGMRFRYAMAGEASPPTEIVSPDEQRAALELLLDALEPRELTLPEPVLQLMAPRPFGYAPDSRAFQSTTGPAFDQIGTARTLATMIVGGILSPQRTARVVAFHDRDATHPSLERILDRMIDRTWRATAPTEHAALLRLTQRVVLDELMALAANPEATVESRAAAEWGIRQIQNHLTTLAPTDPTAEAHRALVLADITRFENRAVTAAGRSEALSPPPGTPIGIPR